MTEEKKYTVADIPAENGIRINNMLLTLLIIVSGAFGSTLLLTLNGLAADVAIIKVANGQTRIRFEDIEDHMAECKRLHESHANRLRAVEIQMGMGRI